MRQLANYEPPVTTRVHAADGALWAEYARERRLYLPIQAMPRLLIAAFLSAEDKNFYKHGGVDPEGLARAVVTQFRRGSGGRQQGGSTITQQVAKNFFLTRDQTVERKQDPRSVGVPAGSDLLEGQDPRTLHEPDLPGSGNYGVAAAALNYFGKSVHELTVSEAAYLAALPKRPSNYHPINHREGCCRPPQLRDRSYARERLYQPRGCPEGADRAAGRDLPPAFAERLCRRLLRREVRREIVDRYWQQKLLEGAFRALHFGAAPAGPRAQGALRWPRAL